MSVAYDHFHDDRRVETLRVPPQSIEAEQNVLGGIMLAHHAFGRVADILGDEDFYRRDHQLIFRAIRELCERRTPCDAVTVGEWFDANGFSELVGNGSYLVELAANTASAANITAYAEIVKDKARLRQLIDAGTEIVNSAFQPQGRATTDIVADALQQLMPLSRSSVVGGPRAMKAVGSEWLEELQRRCDEGSTGGLMTPWSGVNAMTGGALPGELEIVAARPSMGKSAYAINRALAPAMAGKRVLFFSLEMSAASIFNRAVAALMNIPLSWFKSPGASNEDYWPKVIEGVKRLKSSGLVIDDSPGLTWQQVAVRAKREHLSRPLDLVVVDHAHIMRIPGKTRADIELGDISRELKALAKELGCGVLMLAQLNRSVEKRENKRPIMSDLREAGGFEQDADKILFLYRDDYYSEQLGRASEYPGFVEVIVAKQREGETGKVWLRSALQFGRIDDYEGPPPSPTKIKSSDPFDYMRSGDD